ncbi:MAG TPA: hypothetical protein DIC34_15885 [Treponema sp.]|nr:MAG: hypothetical protein A2Y36_12605 [Treponema sp. GWA1_62_8]OHE63770.1 MAG: hypothetical protein A2001_00965 [Treponema sp. GWC1_61_84]OHE68699.1 MAG: hypothetical protein A2413_09405 [Treponema sp. RIFOXYC1_FULL_61_9]HCM27988.1 hypothetical protein [Treponema sp.]
MIVEMKKLTLILLDRERASALRELRRLSVVHLAARAVEGTTLVPILEKKARIESAMRKVEEAVTRKGKAPAGKGVSPIAEGESVTDAVLAFADEQASLETAVAKDKAELDRIAVWGSVDPASFSSLASAGVNLALCEMPARTHASLPDTVRVIVLSKTKSLVRCLLLRSDGKSPEGFPDEASIVPLPESSTDSLRQRIGSAEARIAVIGDALCALSPRKNEMERELALAKAEAEFETARAGMELLTEADHPHSLVCLEGYVPDADLPMVISAAKKHGWALLADDPTADDAVPTKVNNSAIVRVVQPVFDFLGTVPNYREYDISAWFLLFFCFFFAMIFGDAGYGSLLLLSGIGLAVKAKRQNKPVPDAVRLLFLLSGFTIFWGVLTLSWFGIAPDKLPGMLKAVDLYWISNDNPSSGDNVKVVCFYLGTVQLAIAHMKNIKRDFGSLKFLAQIGQLSMVVGMLSLALNLVISSVRFPLWQFAPAMIGGGFALNFIFASYEAGWGFFRGVLKGIIGSLTNIVSVFLGIVNIFADIVSYIRLWAVGLAGLAISQTVNDMVGPMLGEFSLFAVGVVILVLGHSINMILSVLSVIVHGVRLNMLEFSGHLGMEWSGFSYDPFRDRVDTQETTSKEQL